MPIDLDAKLVETATKYAITKNEYNDRVYGATTSTSCLYRDISSLIVGHNKQGQNREASTIDGLLWFGASEDVAAGDIYYHSSEGFLRIVKVIKAKRLVLDNTQQFIKCEVIKQRQLS